MRAKMAILLSFALSVTLFAQSPSVPSLSTIGKFRFDLSPPSTQDFGKTIASMTSLHRCQYAPGSAGSAHLPGEEKNDCKYAAPYMSTYLDAISTSDWDTAKDWVPVDAVQAGFTVAEHIRNLSSRGPFGCKNGECHWVISSSTYPGSFFLCHVGEGQAIPTECEPVLIQDRKQAWLSVIVASTAFENHVQIASEVADDIPGDDRFMFNVHWKHSKIEPGAITSLLRSALSKPRVSLTENRPAYGTSFTCSPRASVVNMTHWEMAQVRVDTTEMPNHFGINLDLVYWMNEQNTEREIDWHMPTTPQKTRFFEEVRGNVRTELSSICPAGRWTGDTLTCD